MHKIKATNQSLNYTVNPLLTYSLTTKKGSSKDMVSSGVLIRDDAN